jgi:hypothetical protein
MNCFVHGKESAVGMCVACQRAVCHSCVARETPRLVCRGCTERGGILGFEYKSRAEIAGWPLLHVALGVDAATMRPKIARGVIAIGNVAVGGVALAGISLGLVTIGGVSLGLLAAFGGAAVGLGVSVGGFAFGSLAIGGAAVGLQYALGGGAIAPAVIDGMHCDESLRALLLHWVGPSVLPPSCLR